MTDARIALYTRLFEGRRKAIRNFLLNKYGSLLWSEVDDVVQETYLKGRNSFDPGRAGAFNTWIILCAMSAAATHLRKRRKADRDAATLFSEPEPEARMLGRVPTPQDMLDSLEKAERLNEFVAALPEPFRETVILVLDGMKCEDVAARLGISRGTVVSRIHRAKKLMAIPDEPGDIAA